jgi:hypothetical protein
MNMTIPNSTQRIIEEITALLPANMETPKPQVAAA